MLYVDVDDATVRRRRVENLVDPRRRDVGVDVLEEHLAGFEPPGDDESAVRVRSADELDQVWRVGR
ncbi:hypothetical protein ABZX12_01805 [Kribbella sp. NPDC003505]|uniref:hypothetical protein n=1 Tax=Kribbella sp. NPDC003505 TaxID=3154448 RepID=UPI0033AEA8CB